VEFALVAPALIVLLIGGFQLGWALHCSASVRWALATSARTLLINPSATASDLKAAMVAKLSGLADAANLAVTVTPDASNPAVKLLRARSVYTHDLSIAFLPAYHLTFTDTEVVPAP
jgi:Flp pilus assembly protein TadG